MTAAQLAHLEERRDARAKDRASRLTIQATYPDCFAVCPMCDGREAATRRRCVLCCGTELVAHPTVAQYAAGVAFLAEAA